MNKPELDRKVAFEMDMEIWEVSRITELFLAHAADGIATGHEVKLRCFGKFKLAKQGGAPPPHKRFGGGDNNDDGQHQRFRVHFSKSVTLNRAIKNRQEKPHGQVRRR